MHSGGQTQTGGTGLAPNIASLLCYIFAPITSIVFLVIEKENKDVRFHAWQGALFGGSVVALHVALNILGFLLGRMIDFFGAVILSFLLPLLWIAILILWVVCVFKAYQGERWKIPMLGDIAAKKAGL